ncbi:hypothetical protein [Leptospira sp. GIMC2001]|uniref:hypothetical protein n=1 Tax=Leptospira sp. GIMC2001 TaxID=1513297 RepID=UPI00234ACEEC|nr:hypothetical protein [Leptospira sp. GIMC2001]WCL48486.1 hypothetical protein O4O04_14400 [Leptospira sp. GIMC2001]
MKIILFLTALISCFSNCANNEDNKNNLFALLFLLHKTNLEFHFINDSSTFLSNARNLNTDQLVNMQGLRKDEYGDGTGDGFQDKFGSASSVSLTMGDIYFWKKGNIPLGEETTENADLTIAGVKQFQDQPGREGWQYIPRLTVSKANEFIGKNLPDEILDGTYDRIGIQFRSIIYTFDSNVLENPDVLSIVETEMQTPNEHIYNEYSDYGTWYSSFYQKCREGSDYNLETCVDRTNAPRYPVNLGAFLPISRYTGHFTIGGNEFDRTVFLENEGASKRKYLGFGGSKKVNRNINSIGYFRESKDIVTQTLLKMYVMPIKIEENKETYNKLKVNVNASNVLHWDSNSSNAKFKPHRYPDDFELFPPGTTDGRNEGDKSDLSNWINWSTVNNLPETCVPDPRPAFNGNPLCFHDDLHSSIAPDFNSPPWSDNQEAPNPAIGKDMNIYLPAMYAELE